VDTKFRFVLFGKKIDILEITKFFLYLLILVISIIVEQKKVNFGKNM